MSVIYSKPTLLEESSFLAQHIFTCNANKLLLALYAPKIVCLFCHPPLPVKLRFCGKRCDCIDTKCHLQFFALALEGWVDPWQ